MKANIIIFILFTFYFLSCTKVANEGIPSYMKINTPTIKINKVEEGSSVHTFSDLWIESEGNNIGAYEYPNIIPVLFKGEKQILISPGIEYNANELERRTYSIFEPFKAKYTFNQRDTVDITPVFEYKKSVIFLNNDDFENTNNFKNLDRTELGDENNIDGKAGVLILSKDIKEKEAITINPIEIPQGKRVFVEFSVKTEVYVEFGFRSIYNSQKFISLLIVRPNNKWHNFYFEISDFILKNQEGKYNFFFNAQKNNQDKEEKVYFDNLKVIQF